MLSVFGCIEISYDNKYGSAIFSFLTRVDACKRERQTHGKQREKGRKEKRETYVSISKNRNLLSYMEKNMHA